MTESSIIDPQSTISNSRAPRRRGGQPGNKNALKHGLYARHYTQSQRAGLKDMAPLEAVAEIHMLRTGLDMVLTLIATCEDEDRKIKLLNSLFTGTARLLSAMRTQVYLVGDNKEILTDFWDTLALYQQEQGL